MISYRAFKRMDFSRLSLDAPWVSAEKAVWLLYQKALAEAPADSEQSDTSLDTIPLPEICDGSIEEYLQWACRLAVLCRGGTWICRQLGGTLMSQPIRPRFIHNRLIMSAYLGDERLVRSLVLGGSDVNQCDELLGSPLAAATSTCRESIARFLLQCEADPEKSVGNLGSPFISAVRLQMERLVRLFLQTGRVNPNQSDPEGGSVLCWASRQGATGIVRLLLDDPSLDLRHESQGRTALTGAAAGGHESIVQWLVNRDEINLGHHDGWDGDPLFEAASRGHAKVVDYLLSRQDLNPNTLSPIHETTSLYEAVRKGYHDVVCSLLRFPAIDPNVGGWTCPPSLNVAAKKGDAEMVEILLAHKDIDVNAPDHRIRTPLLVAARHGHLEVVRLLLEREEIDMESPDVLGRSPLMHASQKGHATVVRLLLLICPSLINKQDGSYNTCLIVAVRCPVR